MISTLHRDDKFPTFFVVVYYFCKKKVSYTAFMDDFGSLQQLDFNKAAFFFRG